MENKNKGWFITLSVIGYLLGISYCFINYNFYLLFGKCRCCVANGY